MKVDLRALPLPGRLLAAAVLALFPAAPLAAQSGSCGTCTAFSLPAFLCVIPGTLTTSSSSCPAGNPKPAGTLCNAPLNTTYNQVPKVTGPTLVPVPLGNGQFKVRLVVHVETPFNTMAGNGALQVFWNSGSTATSPTIDFCNQGATDLSDTYLEFGTFTCANVPQTVGTYSLRAQMAQGIAGSCCTPRADLNNMTVTVTPQLLGCPMPPKDDCEECKVCKLVRGGGANVGGGGGHAGPGRSGPGALLRYHAGGVGFTGFPGTTAWKPTLGRYWSHDYAERIVIDPITGNDSHVWLLTKSATFREFSNKQADGRYATVSPMDEYRKLYRTAGGWDLQELTGTVHHFDGSGLWLQSVDRNGNAKTATYDVNGKLSTVAFPDGRGETFTYYGGGTGKLATLTEVGVGGAASRVWSYTWSASNTGDDLIAIGRPDGTGWAFTYGNAALPGYLTKMELVGTDGSRRVETAWEYDTQGNAVKIWSGAASFTDANAVDKWSLSFDNALNPAVTQVTDPLGNVSTYKFDRNARSDKTRITEIDGDCPSCGTGPQPKFFYDDAANPLRPTRVTDSRGTTTAFAYNADGMATSKVEAMGTPLERTTTWQYGGPFPALVTRIERPSTSGAGVRSTVLTYDGVGNLTDRTIGGVEGGSAFSYTTTTTYNGAGRPVTVDPPGYANQDVTTYTYDPARGSLVALTRTDPIVGTSTFSYDPFNRIVTATDANGAVVETAYDALNRVSTVNRRGGTPAEDLVTTNVYDVFGDLLRVVHPRGNVDEYGFDAAGRPVTTEHKPDAATPGERNVFTLDNFGNRIHEELQRWNGTAWVTDSTTDSVYSQRCRPDKVIHSDGTVTELAYDCEGNVERTWDANHPSANQTNPPTEVYTYDVLNRLAALTQGWGGSGGGSASTHYAYDVQDHLVLVTDANGTVTSYVFGDRDLRTRETSEVSGVTSYAHNEHGVQVSRTDARGVTVSQTVDAANRVVFTDYPDDSLDTVLTYDDPSVPFSKGRLTAITRNGQSVAYRYDRFGRLLTDGSLSYTYDKNGNFGTVVYPGNVTASYTFDYADRPTALSLQDGVNPAQSLVSAASYKAMGPLSALALGNGLSESRAFNGRYFPTAISVAGRLDWAYTTDAMGHVTAIVDNLNAAGSRTFAYQDFQYFLTQGNGPWGSRGWLYDKIGNRLSETRDGTTDTYAYAPNAAGGGSPRLAQIARGAGGNAQFFYDAAGELTFRAEGEEKLRLTYSADQQLSQLRNESDTSGSGISRLAYDGRSFLSASAFSSFPSGATPDRETASTYSSTGVLVHRARQQHRSPTSPRNQPEVRSDAYVLYFADRPVALFEKRLTTPPGGSPSQTTVLTYLTTDHLGAPALATDAAGATVWQGGFEPFGGDWNGARQAGVFLRFPGQWEDASWQDPKLGGALYYNVHRWYDPAIARYTRSDPKWRPQRVLEINPYGYVGNDPLLFTDPLGLERLKVCCNDWDKQHLPEIFNHDAQLQGFVAFGHEDPGPLAINPWGYTNCERFGGAAGSPATEYQNYSPGDCVNACLRVHEQWHRNTCRTRTVQQMLRTNDRLDEGVAYARQLSCQQDAINNGHVDVDVDPLGPGNRVMSSQ